MDRAYYSVGQVSGEGQSGRRGMAHGRHGYRVPGWTLERVTAAYTTPLAKEQLEGKGVFGITRIEKHGGRNYKFTTKEPLSASGQESGQSESLHHLPPRGHHTTPINPTASHFSLLLFFFHRASSRKHVVAAESFQPTFCPTPHAPFVHDF